MLRYRANLKQSARRLRRQQTEAEQVLWGRVRRKQIGGVPFYRQKPIGPYIVDFYAPAARLVIEVDGSQHLEPEHAAQDAARDAYLAALGLTVLRFDNRQVLSETQAVVEAIGRVIAHRSEAPR
jgi:very-short-patch-repair endonuclease